MDQLRTLNIACCGAWHPHARDFARDRAEKYCADLPYRMAAVWDPDEAAGRAWARELGARYCPDFTSLVSDPSIDGIILTAPTAHHARLCVEAANWGKHLYVEKPLAATAAEAMAIREAVRKNNVHFTLSDPPARFPYILCAKKLMDAGLVGRVTSVRIRMGHNEALKGTLPDSFFDPTLVGGGAMMDMGHHGIHSLLLLLGRPLRVRAVLQPVTDRGRASGSDENSIALIEFEGGTLGTVETGWVTPGSQRSLDVYGTRGCLRWFDGVLTLTCRTEGRTVTRRVGPEEFPEPESYPLRYWMENILIDRPETRYDIDTAVRGAAVEEAIYTSWRTGAAADVPRTDT